MDQRAQITNARCMTPPCRSYTPTTRQRQSIKDTVLSRQKHFFESARTVLKDVHAYYAKIITQKNRLIRNKGIIQDSLQEKSRREYEVSKDVYIKEQFLYMTKSTVGIFREDKGYEQEYKNLLSMYKQLLVSHEELKMKHISYVAAIHKLEYSTTDTTPKGNNSISEHEFEEVSCLSISSSSNSPQSKFSTPEEKMPSRVETTPCFQYDMEDTVYLEVVNRDRLEQEQREESRKIRQRFSLGGEPARRLSFEF